VEELLLDPAGVALGAGEIGVLGIDVEEVVPLEVYFVELFA
jgi:hypothetical protein